MAEIASAFVSILPSAKGFGSKLNGQIGGDVDKAGKSSGSRFGKMFAASAAALGGAAAIGSFLKGSIGEAREAQKVGAQTNAVLKSTGGVAGITAKQIGNLATSISLKSGIDDEAIQSSENLLLTFTNLRNGVGKGNDVFNQATKIVTDMSVALGTDAKSSAIQVGKALNDPIKGITALQRVGVSFTAQQKKQIQSMVASGHTMQAQKLILGELNKEFGGSAAAAATSGDKFKVAFGNLQETIGTALLPVIDKVANALTTKVIPAISNFVGQMQSGKGIGGQVVGVFKTLASTLGNVGRFVKQNADFFVPFLAALAAGVVTFKVIAAVTRAWVAAQAALNFVLTANPIGVVVVALAALVAGLVVAYKRSETFRNIVNGAFSAIKTVVGPVLGWLKTAVATVINFVRDHWKLLVSIIGGPIAAVVVLVTNNWGKIKAVSSAAWNAIKAGISGAIKAARAVVSAEINAIKTIVSTGVSTVVNFIKGIPGKISALASTFLSVGKNLGSSVIRGLGEGLRAVGGFASDIASAVKSAINSALHLPFTIHGPGPLPDFTIPAFARGTSFAPGGFALVGEQGPELVNIPRGSQVFTSSRTRSLTRGGDDTDLLLRISGQLDVLNRTVGRQGREFGREINGSASSGKRRSA